MSITSEIKRIKNNLNNAYTALETAGAITPLVKNSNNLANTIITVPASPLVTATNNTGHNINANENVWVNVNGNVIYNFDVAGIPSINNTTKVVNGFSSSNYLKLQDPFDPDDNTWELLIKIATGNDIQTEQTIFHGGYGTGKFGVILKVSDSNDLNKSKFNWAISNNGTEWLEEVAGTHLLLTNTAYWLKFGYDGTEYYLKYSTDGEIFTKDSYYESDALIKSPLNCYFGAYRQESTTWANGFKGSIDLNETSIVIDDTNWWVPSFTDVRTYTIVDSKTITSISSPAVTQENIAINATGQIRILLNGEGTYTPSTKSKTITDNGTYIASTENVYGYSSITVDVEGGGQTINNQDKNITENGTYTADSGYTGLGTVTVDVPGQQIRNQEKSITENGTVFPDYGYTGLGKVIVNVQNDTDVVTAINKTGRNIEVGETVWINKTEDNRYILVPFGLSTNFATYGVTVDADTKIASGFSWDNYIELYNLSSSTNYEFVFKFTTGNDIDTFQNIYCFYPVSEMYIENGALRIWSETAGDNISCGEVETCTTYYGKVVINNGTATLSYSTNGQTYTGAVSIENTNTTPERRWIGFGMNNDRYWRGTIDLSGSYININGLRYWTPKLADITAETVTGTTKDYINNNQSGRVYIGDIIEPKLNSKTITVNGTYRADDDLLDGYNSVTVDVPTSGEQILAVKTITQNGTYDAIDDLADGYSSVTVSVGGQGGSSSFGGLSTSYSQVEGYYPKIQIAGGVLEDYTSYINSCTGLLAPSGYSYINSPMTYENYEKFGDPTINIATGVAYDFNKHPGNALKVTSTDTIENQSWDIQFKTKISQRNHTQTLFGTKEGNHGILFQILDWRFRIWLGNGAGWNIMDNWGWFEPVDYNTYWVKISHNKDTHNYSYSLSEDGIEWTIIESTDSEHEIPLRLNNLYIGNGWALNNDLFDGTLYLDEFTIKINGNTVWTAEKYEELPGLLADGIDDDGTAKTYNLFWNNGFVLDTAQEKQDWEWCGLVGVPAHEIPQIASSKVSGLIGQEKITLTEYIDDNKSNLVVINSDLDSYPIHDVLITQTTLGTNDLMDKFSGVNTLGNVSIPNLQSINRASLSNTFNGSSIKTISMPNLTTVIGENAMRGCFYNTTLKDINFPELITVNGPWSFCQAFGYDRGLRSLTFPKLTTIRGYEAFIAFAEELREGVEIREISFPVLSDIRDDRVFARGICGNGRLPLKVYFPALNTNSFGNYNNQFEEFFEDTWTSEVHFPYVVRGMMKTWPNVLNNFSNNSSKILWDLKSGLVNFNNTGTYLVGRDDEVITKLKGFYHKGIEGNPTIDTTNYTISDFSKYNFVWAKFTNNLSYFTNYLDKDWEFKIKVKTPESTDSRVCIFGTEWDGNGIVVLLHYGHFGFLSGWDGWVRNNDDRRTTDSYTGAFEYSAETDYWIKCGWNSTTYEYYLEYSTDGITYTKDISYYSDRQVRYDAPNRFGAFPWDEEGSSNGAIIYMTEASFKFDNVEQLDMVYTENKNSDRCNLGNTNYSVYDQTNHLLALNTVTNIVDQEVRDITVDLSATPKTLIINTDKAVPNVTLSSDGLTFSPIIETSTRYSLNYLTDDVKNISYSIPRTATTAKAQGTIQLTGLDVTKNITISTLPVRDFTIVGSPTISNEQILSDCTYEDYITIDVSELPEYGFEFIVKAQSFSNEDYNYKQIISYESIDPEHGDYTFQFGKKWEDRLGIHVENSPWERWEDNGEWFPADYTGWFWYAFKQYEWGFEHYYILDDNYTLDTLPALPANWDAESEWSRCGRTDWRDVRMVNGVYHIAQCDRWDDTWPTSIDLRSMVFRDSTTGTIYWRPINESNS